MTAPGRVSLVDQAGASGTTGSSISGDGAGTITARAIAALVGGELIGDGDTVVDGVAPLERAEGHHLTIVANAKYAPLLATSRAGIVLVDPEFRDVAGAPKARIIVAQPQEKLLAVLARIYPTIAGRPGVAATARIGRGVKLGDGVSVGEFAVVGAGTRLGNAVSLGAHCTVGDGVIVGDGSRLWPGSTVYSGSVIGKRVLIQSGARIGCDGFGYVFLEGSHRKIPHVGRCVIEDDVEVGANSTVDRGSIDDTVIGEGTKIDNLVHIAHNVRLGKKCLVMAQVGIAGSTTIGDGVILAGQAGIGGHISIGAGARIAGQAGVFGDVPAGESWSGYPARPHRESLRASAALLKLAGMMRRLEQLLESSAPR